MINLLQRWFFLEYKIPLAAKPRNIRRTKFGKERRRKIIPVWIPLAAELRNICSKAADHLIARCGAPEYSIKIP